MIRLLTKYRDNFYCNGKEWINTINSLNTMSIWMLSKLLKNYKIKSNVSILTWILCLWSTWLIQINKGNFKWKVLEKHFQNELVTKRMEMKSNQQHISEGIVVNVLILEELWSKANLICFNWLISSLWSITKIKLKNLAILMIILKSKHESLLDWSSIVQDWTLSLKK